MCARMPDRPSCSASSACQCWWHHWTLQEQGAWAFIVICLRLWPLHASPLFAVNYWLGNGDIYHSVMLPILVFFWYCHSSRTIVNLCILFEKNVARACSSMFCKTIFTLPITNHNGDQSITTFVLISNRHSTLTMTSAQDVETLVSTKSFTGLILPGRSNSI